MDTQITDKTKKRHPLLSIWLTLIIIYSITFTILYLTGTGVTKSSGVHPGVIPIIIILLILQIVCAVALFRWKKWGFWGYCIVNVIGLIVDIWLGVNMIGPSITVLAGIAGLYGVLHSGQENKGWPQLD